MLLTRSLIWAWRSPAKEAFAEISKTPSRCFISRWLCRIWGKPARATAHGSAAGNKRRNEVLPLTFTLSLVSCPRGGHAAFYTPIRSNAAGLCRRGLSPLMPRHQRASGRGGRRGVPGQLSYGEELRADGFPGHGPRPARGGCLGRFLYSADRAGRDPLRVRGPFPVSVRSVRFALSPGSLLLAATDPVRSRPFPQRGGLSLRRAGTRIPSKEPEGSSARTTGIRRRVVEASSTSMLLRWPRPGGAYLWAPTPAFSEARMAAGPGRGWRFRRSTTTST